MKKAVLEAPKKFIVKEAKNPKNNREEI